MERITKAATFDEIRQALDQGALVESPHDGETHYTITLAAYAQGYSFTYNYPRVPECPDDGMGDFDVTSDELMTTFEWIGGKPDEYEITWDDEE